MRLQLLFFFFCVLTLPGRSQTGTLSTANAHSHNDYENALPFWEAWKNGFGSIEADIYLHGDKLVVAHDSAQLQRQWTLDSLYLQPLVQCILTNKGSVYKDKQRVLQLMIDIKSDSLATMQKLVAVMQAYPALTATPSLQLVISGSRPDPAAYTTYPHWILFDGDLQKEYTAEQLERIPMMSGNFKKIAAWNGRGRMTAVQTEAVRSLVEKTHRQGKKIRFWNAPDNLNTWLAFTEAGIDYLNTDRIPEISAFFRSLPYRQFKNPDPHVVTDPTYRNDGASKPIKNIILLIGDGTGLAHWQAAYTANKGALHLFTMRHTGLSKTSSADSYITDSAPGATALSAGTKTNNRAVGVDATGKSLALLPEILSGRGMKTGIITTGDIRDATPAAFYAHRAERSSFEAILDDLFRSPVALLLGALPMKAADSTKVQKSRFQILPDLDLLPPVLNQPVVVADRRAALPVAGGRGDWAKRAFRKASTVLSKNKEGFFLVVEGAQVDHGGHKNDLPYLVSELLDLDKVIGEAMSFADSNGETLVIVTGDHETGGLTLTGGDDHSGRINGQFSTDDHTASPVPVFAYGPYAQLFTGPFENTAIFHKILQALDASKRNRTPAK